jgi:hypothetical protein
MSDETPMWDEPPMSKDGTRPLGVWDFFRVRHMGAGGAGGVARAQGGTFSEQRGRRTDISIRRSTVTRTRENHQIGEVRPYVLRTGCFFAWRWKRTPSKDDERVRCIQWMVMVFFGKELSRYTPWQGAYLDRRGSPQSGGGAWTGDSSGAEPGWARGAYRKPHRLSGWWIALSGHSWIAV